MKWGAWQFLSCTGKALSRANCDPRRAREEKEKTEEKKPVSLSVSEVKWMCNLLSRETRCVSRRAYVCVVVDCEFLVC